MREGWEMKKLGEVCGFVRGPFGGSLKKGCFVEDGFAVYEQQHAIYDQFDEIRYFVDENKFNEMKRFELLSGDLIMSCSGTMGKVAIVPNGIRKGIINQALLKLTPKKNINIQYLRYWMVSDVFKQSIEKHSKGAAIKNVASVAILKNIEFPVPPLPEQQQIVAYLDQTFANLNQAKANTLKNLQNAKELFETELRNIFENKGEGWEEKRFDEACVLQRGFDLPTHSRIHGKYALVTSNGITDRINQFKVKSPGVATGRSGTIGNIHFIEEDYWPLNTALYIKNFHGNDEKFIYYFLIWFNLGQFSSGAGVPTLNRNHVHSEKVCIPKSLQTQQEIVAKLDALKTQTQALEASYQAKLNNLEELYSGILKRAFEPQLIEA